MLECVTLLKVEGHDPVLKAEFIVGLIQYM
jgi:hypothetical protein